MIDQVEIDNGDVFQEMHGIFTDIMINAGFLEKDEIDTSDPDTEWGFEVFLEIDHTTQVDKYPVKTEWVNGRFKSTKFIDLGNFLHRRKIDFIQDKICDLQKDHAEAMAEIYTMRGEL